MPDIVGDGDNLGNHIATKGFKQIKGADIASADAITFGTDGNTFDITGTTTINHFNTTNWEIGSIIVLHFDGAVALTHNVGSLSGVESNILLSGDSTYTTTAGDILTFVRHDSTNWQEISRNSGTIDAVGDIGDVTISGIGSGEIIKWNGSAWINQTLGETGIATLTGLETLASKTLTSPVLNTGVSGSAVLDSDTMSGASATTLSSSESIKAYVDAQVATENTIDEMNDTTISGIASGEILKWNGSAWVNQTLAEATIASNALTSGRLFVGNGSNIATGVALSGDATITNAGAIAVSDLTVSGETAQDLLYYNGSNWVRLAKGTDGQVLKTDSGNLTWGSGGGGATIVHTYTNTNNASYVGTASSFGTVGVGDRDIYIKKVDSNNEGVFTKIWKNGSAVEVQLA